jgi:CRISPR system Cascade subunit CasE
VSYLTEIRLDFASASRQRLFDTYRWHQAVWKAFPGHDGERRDFLTRLDRGKDGFRLLVVSDIKPERPEWCPDSEQNWRTKPIPETFFTRSRYRFQLCANPTKKVAKELPDQTLTKNGKRVPLRTRAELLCWIARKGEQGGFVVEEETLRTTPRGREHFHSKDHAGLHSAVEFEGILSVTDRSKFYGAFTKGIGSAKAFGYGLLVLAPVS